MNSSLEGESRQRFLFVTPCHEEVCAPFLYGQLVSVADDTFLRGLSPTTCRQRYMAVVFFNRADICESHVFASETSAGIPVVQVLRARRAGRTIGKLESHLVRRSIDHQWRAICMSQLSDGRLSCRGTLDMLRDILTRTGRQPNIAELRRWHALRGAPETLTDSSDDSARRLALHPKELLDWVLALRIASTRGLGATIEQCLREIGTSLRTFRRVQKRLAQHLDAAPVRLTPQVIIRTIAARLDEQRTPIGCP